MENFLGSHKSTWQQGLMGMLIQIDSTMFRGHIMIIRKMIVKQTSTQVKNKGQKPKVLADSTASFKTSNISCRDFCDRKFS